MQTFGGPGVKSRMSHISVFLCLKWDVYCDSELKMDTMCGGFERSNMSNFLSIKVNGYLDLPVFGCRIYHPLRFKEGTSTGRCWNAY